MNSEIILIEGVESFDSMGNAIIAPSETKKKAVFAEIRSIGSTELYQAWTVKKNPVMKAVVFADEYNKEPFLQHDGEIYEIYKDFKKGEKVELTCEVKRKWV